MDFYLDFYQKLTKQVENWLIWSGEMGITDVTVTKRVWDAVCDYASNHSIRRGNPPEIKPATVSIEFHTQNGKITVHKPSISQSETSDVPVS